ncbi:hypothetical protein GJ496_007987 [Pomphorhynchus laevis]|nr:hypothetical protein GJ496_007987 [Pomphorhynchus laevis]
MRVANFTSWHLIKHGQKRFLSGLPERYLPLKPLHPIKVHPFQESLKINPVKTMYRDPNPLNNDSWFCQIFGGFMWWYFLWYSWNHPEAYTGHFPFFDARTLSDEELGIPPDDYEES